jgi:hypothetical protein
MPGALVSETISQENGALYYGKEGLTEITYKSDKVIEI